jgi:hypothetical protein
MGTRAQRCRATTALGLCAAVVLTVGCGGPKYVKVTGTVSMDGKALANTVVTFQPVGGNDNPNPGRGSSGVTDSNGRYTLSVEPGKEGAVPGKHKVTFATNRRLENVDPALGSPDGVRPKEKDVIPRRYHDPGEEFTVPPEGTDKADFELKSK